MTGPDRDELTEDQMRRFVVTDNGYLWLEHYPDPDGHSCDGSIREVQAGDTLHDLLTAALNHTCPETTP